MTIEQLRSQLFNAFEKREAAQSQADAADVEIKALRSALAGYALGEQAAKADAKDGPMDPAQR